VRVFGPLALALVAGAISFTSPCCLPLMPGYISYVGGVDAAGTTGVVTTRTRTLAAAALFVVGFSATFTLMGFAASSLSAAILHHRLGLERLAGVIVIAMGIATIGVLRVPLLAREARIDLKRIRPGLGGAAPLGAAFAIGWTPCIGPVLTAILAAAASTESGPWGAMLLLAYSLGLGIPFLLLAWGYSRSGRLLGWFRRHARAVEITGGAVLIAMGILMITGAWLRLFAPLLRLYASNGWPPI
jgi:cytochrome c-type biogenesis protein